MPPPDVALCANFILSPSVYNSGMDTQKIEHLIQAGLPDARVTVSGGEGKFEATVISSAFEGLNAVKRHQLVYGTVREQIADGSVHALTIRPFTPDERDSES